MTDYARVERRQLADLLLQVGPDRPTVNEGWTTRDLAAHLVVRDRRPDAMIGVLIPPLAGHGEHVRRAKAAQPYPQVVQEVRTPPWWSPVSNPLVDALSNTVEFFIHHEDVRRATPGFTRRELEPGEQRALWSATKLTARLALRRAGLPVRIEAPGFGTLRVGAGEPVVTLTGEPGELALFVSGRQRVAQVEVTGAPAAVERLNTARIGL
ncbi:TIGR03085 family metal-binding protein [Amorphoplanes nipponensis]|uniref:TIGR03085 family protein n=1 Tax=Actinoplanes nipponensis TaxID=135950 RepID=A0A919JBK3_9ACTN|nr:TIGR03085 family metal-binding protein [Actinoplanes nipponensis]GIE46592.1 TIGR03085 family protein [Actinoplanes nipponensis]